MRQNLKKATQDYYQQFELDKEQLAEFDQLIQSDSRPAPPHRSKPSWWLTAAASLVLLASVAFIMLSYQTEFNEARILAIVEEVSKEHLEQDPLEITGQQFASVSGYFDKLDFALSPTMQIPSSMAVLQGGRYCSIQSVKAAQLRYGTGGNAITLYQVPYDKRLHGAIPDINREGKMLVRHSRGIEVKLWVENGLLMTAARKMHQAP